MNNKHWRVGLLAWLLGGILASLLLYHISGYRLQQQLSLVLQQHLASTLDHSRFDQGGNSVSDGEAIRAYLRRVNAHIATYLKGQRFALVAVADVAVVDIDGFELSAANPPERLFTHMLQINQRMRPVGVAWSGKVHWPSLIVLSISWGAICALLIFCLPRPFSQRQKLQIEELLCSGCPKHLAIATVTDSRVQGLSDNQFKWLVQQLGAGTDLDLALVCAQAEDTVDIDLSKACLKIHGVEVVIAKTPFFYYVWYLLKRQEGDGWVTNPPANRPDIKQGKQLAELMSRYGGHARALDELENTGLKAKTVDQNRSKVKELLIDVLGEELAQRYLFQSEKDALSGRMRYRIALPAHSIILLNS